MFFSNCDNTLKFFDFFKMISLVFSPKNYQFYMLKESTNLLEVSSIKVLEWLKIRKDIVTLFQHSRDQSDRFLAKCFTYIVIMSCSKYLSSIFFNSSVTHLNRKFTVTRHYILWRVWESTSKNLLQSQLDIWILIWILFNGRV